MSSDPVNIRLQRMAIRGLVFVIVLIALFIFAFYDGRVNEGIVSLFEKIAIACAVFFFGDVISLGGIKRIGKKPPPE